MTESKWVHCGGSDGLTALCLKKDVNERLRNEIISFSHHPTTEYVSVCGRSFRKCLISLVVYNRVILQEVVKHGLIPGSANKPVCTALFHVVPYCSAAVI